MEIYKQSLTCVFLSGCTRSIWKFLGWGLNPSCSCGTVISFLPPVLDWGSNLCLCSNPSLCSQILNPLYHSRNSYVSLGLSSFVWKKIAPKSFQSCLLRKRFSFSQGSVPVCCFFPRYSIILGMPSVSESKKALWVSVHVWGSSDCKNLFESSHFTGKFFSKLSVNFFFVRKVPCWFCTLGWNLKSFCFLSLSTFFFSFFGHPTAYGVPKPGIRWSCHCDLYHNHSNARSFNPLCWAGDWTCVPGLQRHHQSPVAIVETPLVSTLKSISSYVSVICLRKFHIFYKSFPRDKIPLMNRS